MPQPTPPIATKAKETAQRIESAKKVVCPHNDQKHHFHGPREGIKKHRWNIHSRSFFLLYQHPTFSEKCSPTKHPPLRDYKQLRHFFLSGKSENCNVVQLPFCLSVFIVRETGRSALSAPTTSGSLHLPQYQLPEMHMQDGMAASFSSFLQKFLLLSSPRKARRAN